MWHTKKKIPLHSYNMPIDIPPNSTLYVLCVQNRFVSVYRESIWGGVYSRSDQAILSISSSILMPLFTHFERTAGHPERVKNTTVFFFLGRTGGQEMFISVLQMNGAWNAALDCSRLLTCRCCRHGTHIVTDVSRIITTFDWWLLVTFC